jgi:hypothetical protein
MSRRSIGIALVAVALGCATARAQVRQYTPPGGPASAVESREAALESAAEEARWNLGPIRLDPAFWLSDIAYVRRPDADSDFTARVGAGVRAYVPVGSRTTLAAYALPEYVWWKDRSDERRVNQRFGVGSFTYFNRLSVEVTGERREDFDFVTSEALQRTTGRTDTLDVAVELPIGSRLALFVGGTESRFESLAESAELDELFGDLDRRDVAYRGGLRYYPTELIRFGAGAGSSETEFESTARDRDNSGEFWYAELSYGRPKLSASVDYRQNELAGESGSAFGTFEGETGSVSISWNPRQRFGVRLYASRALAYSILDLDDTAYVDERTGAALQLGIGRRISLGLFGERGTLDYRAELGGSDHADDVEAWGATLGLALGKLSVDVGYRVQRIRPGDDAPESEIEEVLGSVRFGFGVGSPGTWY